MPTLIERWTRKKVVDFGNEELKRALTLLDLTFLGIGSTIGVGFYVLVGDVARNIAGPAVIISFLIAGIASIFAGLCYAEFGGRVPKAGSAYIYSYVCVGECVAFIIGWNLVLEYVIGASSVARGFSGYIDALAYKAISNGLEEVMPMNISFLSDYPDFLSLGLILFVTVLLAVGIKESTLFNNIFSSINMLVVIYVIIAAATIVDTHNWNLSINETETLCNNTEEEENWGNGGFAPYGFSGVMRGAATCFFGFVGFDCIATTGEEAINPSRNIPLSICVSLLVIFLAYFGMAATITMATPYCLLDPDAALVSFFADKDMDVSKYIVAGGALFGFSASLIGVLIPLPRIIYAMANDGVIFRFLAKVNKRFQTPALATILTGTLAAAIALIFDLEALVDMMSIGTLMAYTIVAVSVMLLRYMPSEDEEEGTLVKSPTNTKGTSGSVIKYSTKDIMGQLFNSQKLSDPTELSGFIASYATLVFCLLVSILALLLALLEENLYNGEAGAIVGVVLLFLLNALNLIIIWRQPESKKSISFKVPFVPWMPGISALINVYLMFNLSPDTWIRFGVWMAIGMPIYFFYGMCNSTEELRSKDPKYGIDNPAGPKKDSKAGLFVIPTINVQLATPMNSAPGTPQTVHSTKEDPRPTMVAKSAKTANEANGGGNDIENALESFDKIVDEAPLENKDIREPVGAPETGTTIVNGSVSASGSTSSHGSSDPKNENLRDELEENIKLIQPVDFDLNENVSNSDLHYETIDEGRSKLTEEKIQESNDKTTEVLEMQTAVNESSECLETKNSSDETSEAQETQDIHKSTETSEILKKDDTTTDVNETENGGDKPFIPIPPAMPEILRTVPIIDSAKRDVPEETLNATVDKAKKKPVPLDLAFENSSDSRRSSLKSSSSEPQIAIGSPTSPVRLASFPSRGSVPTTPSARRHPTKILKRNSSFDEIPPSSLDSPLVRRVNKFFIIPVQEPDVSASEGNSPQLSPSPSVQVEKKDGESREDLMTELKKRFNQLYETNKEDESPKTEKMFYIGSDDSLDTMVQSGDLSSTTSTRDFKRVPSKEAGFLGEGLDTIRERGESKIYAEDAQTDVNQTNITDSSEPYVDKGGEKVTSLQKEEKNPPGHDINETSPSSEKEKEDSEKSSKELTQEQTDVQTSASYGENIDKLRSLFGS